MLKLIMRLLKIQLLIDSNFKKYELKNFIMLGVLAIFQNSLKKN